MKQAPKRAATGLRRTLVTGAAVSCAIGLPVAAQNAETGGVLWSFTVSQSVVSETNPGLDRPDAPTETFARTDLGLDLSSSTRTQSFGLSLSGALEYGDVEPKGLKDPSVAISYSQEAASSSIATDLFLSETDVDDLAFLIVADEFGNPTLITAPDTGTRRQYGGGLRYEWGSDAPFGGTLSLRRVETDYVDTTDPGLVDSTRDSAALSFRFDLSPVTSLTARASTSRLDEDGAASTSVTDTLGLTLSTARPDGALSISAVATDTEDGTRTSLSFGRNFALPNGALEASLGVEDSAFGGTGMNGALTWAIAGPNNSLSLGVQHGVTQDSRDTETRRTAVTVGLEQALTQRLSGTLDLALRDSEVTQTGLGTLTGSVTAGLTYALTEDWGMSLSATHRIEEEDGLSRADSTRVSLSVRRTFQFRP